MTKNFPRQDERSFSDRTVSNYGSVVISLCKSDKSIHDTQDRGERKRKWILVKPDGGWGWLIVLGVALSNMTTQSLISIFGLLFMRRLPELNINTSGMSLIVSVQITVFNFFGLFAAPVLKKFSCRRVSIIGVAFVFLGLILTGYANSLWTFIVTYSALTGIGMGCLYPSSFVAINSYFSEWRARAVGLTVTATGVGQMLLPFLVRYLLDEYAFRGTILILAALSSHSFLGACLYHPVHWHMKKKHVAEEEKIVKRISDTENADDMNLDAENSPKNPAAFRKEKTGLFSQIFQTMDWDLLKDPSFLNLIIGLGLVYSSNILFQMLLPFFLESVGYSKKDIAVCLSVMSGADIIGRLIISFITDIFKLKTKTVLFLGAGLSLLSRSGVVCYNKGFHQLNYTLLLSALCGIFRSAIVCNFNLSVSDQTSSEKLPSALGFHMLFKAFSIIIFGPLIGFLRDYTNSYFVAMHIMSLLFLGLPFLLWLLEFIGLKNRGIKWQSI